MAPKKRPTSTTPTRAVCYVRISVDRDDETSTETQEERVRAYCTAHGWTVVDVIVEPGRSAYKASRSTRPGFRKVMGLVSTGAADVLVVWKLDRACRDTVDTLNLVNELAEHDAQLASVTEHFDTSTATGRMTLTVLAALAEMESATKSERVQAWQDKRLASGATPTGPRPFGYRRERNRLLIVDAEAVVIRRAADEVLAGKSLRSIVRDLTAAGVVGRSGKPFSNRTLREMLLAPTIAACREVEPGVFVRSDVWEPILDRETWNEVRAVLLDPARRTGPGNARRWLLSGIAGCGRCKGDDGNPVAMGSKPHAAGPRYSCPSCHLSIEAKRTEAIVETKLHGVLDPETYRHLRQGRPVVVNPDDFEEASAKLMARFVAKDIDETQLANLAGELRRQHEVASAPPPRLPDVDDPVEAWPSFTPEQKRVVLSAATESLTIKPWKPSASFDKTRVVWVSAV